jgi:hypothetical protein
VNTYSGQTRVDGGTLIVNGSLLGGGPLTNNPGTTLGGSGIIAGPVTLTTAVLAPGDPVGTLTISNTLTLDGLCTTIFDVSATGADQIRGLTTVTYAGALQIVLSGSLPGNMVFKLFDAATYEGVFDPVNVPTLPAPLSWDTTHLTTDGTLRVIGGPEVSSFGLTADHNFQLSGTGPTDQPYRILATTNISQAVSDWVQVGTGSFTGGTFSFTDLNATNYPRRFYRVFSP